ncbi:hypothetical protein SESBI_46210 [Sesbania bispinosa]|nr:hypothetical protein SESBI_46210 [Sesbania bispinosa]
MAEEFNTTWIILWEKRKQNRTWPCLANRMTGTGLIISPSSAGPQSPLSFGSSAATP